MSLAIDRIIPPVELVWLKKIDFYPAKPPADGLKKAGTVCIATKSRSLGDALALTTLPEKLSAAYPDLRIVTYPRGFNPVVFEGNPDVDGLSWIPGAIYGDDSNWGDGQQIQLKERFFDLPISDDPRPIIYLRNDEKAWAANFLQDHLIPLNEGKPLCVIHPWGHTHSKVAPVYFWDKIVARWEHAFRFWQVGMVDHSAVQGCEYYFFLPPGRRWLTRRLFAILQRADAFIGVDSGPMHTARAFDIPSLVMLQQADPVDVFARRARGPYFLHDNRRFTQLYARNSHLCPSRMNPEEAHAWIDSFLEERAAAVAGRQNAAHTAQAGEPAKMN